MYASTGGCRGEPCMFGSTCVETDDTAGYKCYCAFGYTGANCQVRIPDSVDPCIFNQCENGASCMASGTAYTCVCAGGFVGQFCLEGKLKI